MLGPVDDLTSPAEDAFSARVAVTGAGTAVFGWSVLDGPGYRVQGRARTADGTVGPPATISTSDRTTFDAGVTRTAQRMENAANAR